VPRLLLFLTLVLLAGCHRPAATTTQSPLTREAYVWQQAESPALTDAVRIALPELSSLSFHAADIHFAGKTASVQKFPIPWSLLAKSGKPVSLVIRIYSGSLGSPEIDPMRDLIHDLLAATHEAGLTCREIQLDYDCSESYLPDYAEYLGALRRAVPEVPLPITALPTWLPYPEFRDLARIAGQYVLQVHSLTLPGPRASSVTLFDPATARRAIQRASDIGLPFRLALPTYRCNVIMDTHGRRGSAYSENATPPLEFGQHYLSGTAEPTELAAFVNKLQSTRPPFLTGIIWYRLPISTDRMNWPWSTFQLVSQGRVPISRLESKLEPHPEGFSTIVIRNTGEQPEVAPATVKASWPAAAFIAADGLAGYSVEKAPDSSNCLFRSSLNSPPTILPPGASLTVGWLRLKPSEVAHISLE
jgi:Protein of unknown function (DUF3142)